MKKPSHQTIDAATLGGCVLFSALMVSVDTYPKVPWQRFLANDMLLITAVVWLLLTLIVGIVAHRKSYIPWRNSAVLLITHLSLSLLYQHFDTAGMHSGPGLAFVGLASGVYLLYCLLPFTVLYIASTLVMFVLHNRRRKRETKSATQLNEHKCNNPTHI